MEFRKYQHIERFGSSQNVGGIEQGICYVFPKIDGTNSSTWLNNGELKAGSHNRELTLDKDNAGFYNAVSQNENIKDYLTKHPTHRLFGEWLVPHSLKTYREDAWRRFYIFDVCIDNDEVETGLEYIPYEIYKPLLEEFNLDYIAPIAIIKNGEYDNFIRCLEQNIFLIKDGQGFGEGIVIKNYDYYNKYNRQNWAKIVTSEFKEKHTKTMGCPVVDNKMVEESIVDEFITTAFVEKEYAKIVNEQGDWNSKLIPQLLGIVYHELVTEEIWNICKKFKNPTINFKTLNNMTINKIKSIKPEIFG